MRMDSIDHVDYTKYTYKTLVFSKTKHFAKI